MDKDYSSLTQFLVDVYKHKNSQLDAAYGLIGQIREFEDPNVITLNQIKEIKEKLDNSSKNKVNSHNIGIGRNFYESTLQTYLRFIDRDGNLSNKRAESLRRLEKRTLERILERGEN